VSCEADMGIIGEKGKKRIRIEPLVAYTEALFLSLDLGGCMWLNGVE